MKRILRRPMIGLAFFFLCGTGAGLTWSIAPPLLFLLAGLALALAALLSLPPHGSTLLQPDSSLPASLAISVAIAALAWAHCQQMVQQYAALPPDLVAGKSPHAIQLMGIIDDDPLPVESSPKARTWKFTLRLEGIRSDTNAPWTGAAGQIPSQWTSSIWSQHPQYGDRWILTGRFMTPSSNWTHRQSFQYRFGAQWRQCRFQSAGHGNAFLARCFTARTEAARRLAYGIEDHPAEIKIIHSLLLGYRQQMPRETYQTFAATGTVHIFAISGSHVMVMAGIVIFVLMACGVSRVNWILWLGPVLILFTLSTGMEPSAVRACIMAVVYWLAPRFHRRSDIYSSLGFAAILILLFDPHDLQHLGFILSFAAVLGIVILYPVCMRPFERLLAPDPLRLQTETLLIRILRYPAQSLAQLIATSAAAWLVSAPLTAYYFNLFSPIALVGNLIALPVSFLIMLTGCLSLVLGAALPWFADVFNHANAVLSDILTWCMQVLTDLPGGHWKVDSPALWILAAFYLLVGIMAWRLTADRKPMTLYGLDE